MLNFGPSITIICPNLSASHAPMIYRVRKELDPAHFEVYRRADSLRNKPMTDDLMTIFFFFSTFPSIFFFFLHVIDFQVRDTHTGREKFLGNNKSVSRADYIITPVMSVDLCVTMMLTPDYQYDNCCGTAAAVPRYLFSTPRVVADQKAKFESDELFKRLSRDSEVSILKF